MNPETFRKNKNKKRKILKLKELCLPDTLPDKFPANCTKICTTLSFLSLSFLFLYIKFPFKNFIVLVTFSNQYPNKKAAELTVKTYCFNLLCELPLMAH